METDAGAIQWGPPPGPYVRGTGGAFWRDLIERCIATGEAAYLAPGALPLAGPHPTAKAISAFCRKHPDQVRARGYRVHTQTTRDGGLAVWATALKKRRPRR